MDWSLPRSDELFSHANPKPLRLRITRNSAVSRPRRQASERVAGAQTRRSAGGGGRRGRGRARPRFVSPRPGTRSVNCGRPSTCCRPSSGQPGAAGTGRPALRVHPGRGRHQPGCPPRPGLPRTPLSDTSTGGLAMTAYTDPQNSAFTQGIDELLPCGLMLSRTGDAWENRTDDPHLQPARTAAGRWADSTGWSPRCTACARRPQEAADSSAHDVEPLTRRVMDVVRMELRPGRPLCLGDPAEDLWIMEAVAARAVRAAAETVSGVRAASCRPLPPTTPSGSAWTSTPRPTLSWRTSLRWYVNEHRAGDARPRRSLRRRRGWRGGLLETGPGRPAALHAVPADPAHRPEPARRRADDLAGPRWLLARRDPHRRVWGGPGNSRGRGPCRPRGCGKPPCGPVGPRGPHPGSR